LSKSSLLPTPFNFNKDNPTVRVASGAGPYENTRNALAGIDLSPASGRRVLLKPNAGRVAEAGVAAAIDIFREAGAEVVVGESPITGIKTHEAFAKTGIKAVADVRCCPLLDMDERPFVAVDIPAGEAIQRIKVCPEVLEYDIIVSIPVMKMHMHTGVTLAVKNMKGCLWRRSKVDLHMLPKLPGREDEKSLNIAIADMATVLFPHLSIIDGTVGMEGLGPSAGKAKTLGVVLAGVDPFATDAVACELMGVSARDIPHLCLGARRGCGVIDMERIQVTPDTWRNAAVSFALPPTNLSLEFPGVTILDNQSCSACQSSLLLFLKKYGEQLFDAEGGKTPIAIGKGHESLPPGTLCIGNCTARFKDGRPFVPGCPPVVSQILAVYDEYFK